MEEKGDRCVREQQTKKTEPFSDKENQQQDQNFAKEPEPWIFHDKQMWNSLESNLYQP